MRCSRCYMNKEKNENDEWPQMKPVDGSDGEKLVCPQCGYTLIDVKNK